jgi:hypothetical protein
MAGLKEVKEFLEKSTKYNNGKPLQSNKLIFDAPTSQLEPIYFWILDFMNEGGLIKKENIRKIVDNFSSSPGGGHFGEMGMRVTKMQEEGMKVLGTINQVVKSILNLVYDLKEWQIRLDSYEKAKSSNPKEKEAGLLALKQIWLDQVDMKRGRGSVHQMTYELGYTTLRDAFMIANSKEDAENMASKDGLINDQVKRILIPRIEEFNKWVEMSEKELKKRFEIEKSYLKTQVESLKLYASWAKPYLKAAEDLKMKGFQENPAMVNAFNTSMFELVLMGKLPIDIKSETETKGKNLPEEFFKYIQLINSKIVRNYNSVVLISFLFRGIPQRITQRGDYGFGGRIEMTFDCYSLNDDEIKVFDAQLKKDAVDFSFSLIKDSVDAPLEQLKEDLDNLLGEKEKKKEEKKEDKKEDDINPFSALFSLFKFKKEEKKEDKKEIKELKDVKPDNYIEESLRYITASSAISVLYRIYDVYKKAHGQASSPEPFDPNKLEPGQLDVNSDTWKLKQPGASDFLGSIKKSWGQK